MVDTNNLSELSGLAQKLNSKSDDLNKSIQALNQQLAALNLGLEVWLSNFPLDDSGFYLEFPDWNYDRGERHRKTTVLGYCKVIGEWQLAVREEECNYADEEPVLESSDTQPLLQASREIRLRAASRFDILISRLKQKAVEMLGNVEKAATLASVR
jgi:hypothetical protein